MSLQNDTYQALKGAGKAGYVSNQTSADTLARKLGGKVKELNNGYMVEVPNGKKAIKIRIMNAY